MGTVEMGKVDRLRAWKCEIPNGVGVGQDDDGLPVLNGRFHRSAGGRSDEESRKRPHQSCSFDVDLILVAVQVFVPPLGRGEVDEVPGQQRLGQREICVDSGCRQIRSKEVYAALEIAPFGEIPSAGNGFVINVTPFRRFP